MNIRPAFLFALLAIASPALADKLVFDHRLVPALKQVLDANDPARISYNDSNPRYVVDVIAVRGKSATDWTEALVIIARTPDRKVATVEAWRQELQKQARHKCESSFTDLASGEHSLTFERKSQDCPAGYPPIAIYRVVEGKTSLFLLAAMSKDGFSAEERAQWLALMDSAHLE